MLAGFGWLVIVWVIWTALFIVTMWLIRFTMNGQQEFVAEQEAEINAAQARSGVDTSAAPGSAVHGPTRPASSERPTPRTPAPLGPPLSAT